MRLAFAFPFFTRLFLVYFFLAYFLEVFPSALCESRKSTAVGIKSQTSLLPVYGLLETGQIRNGTGERTGEEGGRRDIFITHCVWCCKNHGASFPLSTCLLSESILALLALLVCFAFCPSSSPPSSLVRSSSERKEAAKARRFFSDFDCFCKVWRCLPDCGPIAHPHSTPPHRPATHDNDVAGGGGRTVGTAEGLGGGAASSRFHRAHNTEASKAPHHHPNFILWATSTTPHSPTHPPLPPSTLPNTDKGLFTTT